MVEYQRSRRIQASPEDVFAFVANVQNLPTFLPTVQSVEPISDDRVRVQGAVGGSRFEDEGWVNVDQARRGLEWRVEERNYSGWMTVSGVDSATEVVTHLSLAPRVNESGRPLTGERSGEPDPIEEGLEAAMDSLRNLLEGRGGKEQPSTVE